MRFKEATIPGRWRPSCSGRCFCADPLSLSISSAFPLGFLRYLAASVALAAFLLVTRTAPPARSDWKWFILSGASGFFLYMLVFNKAARRSPPPPAASCSRRPRS